MFSGKSNVSSPLLAAAILIALLSACSAKKIESVNRDGPPIQAGATPNQTGIKELDHIIEATLTGDMNEFRSLLEFTQTNCTHTEGLGGPPKCLNGEAEGMPVEVLPFLGSEGYFIRRQDIGSWKGLHVSRLYAVYETTDAVYSDENYPKGEYAIVFINSGGTEYGITLQVAKGHILRIDEGFTMPPEILESHVARYLVEPVNLAP
ncbi:MAG: hypothetical protein QY332_01150 [Anaerolineales bacterium]|nr:MAG: hypothetical protein QY332_01150 [Anaerolineales bacterium]